MTELVEQRYCIKFCQKLGDTQSETIRKIQQAFGIPACRTRRQDGALSVQTIAAFTQISRPFCAYTNGLL
jgi:hypothetical protein